MRTQKTDTNLHNVVFEFSPGYFIQVENETYKGKLNIIRYICGIMGYDPQTIQHTENPHWDESISTKKLIDESWYEQ